MKDKVLKDLKEISQTVADDKDIKLIEAITKMHYGALNRSFWKSPLLPVVISNLLGTGDCIF